MIAVPLLKEMPTCRGENTALQLAQRPAALLTTNIPPPIAHPLASSLRNDANRKPILF
jgi:hypothetical protein